MSLFVAIVSGSNAVSPYAYLEHCGKVLKATVRADGKVCIGEEDDAFPPVALFGCRELARTVALACRWNGQTFEVRPALGSVRTTGRILPVGTVAKVHGCQETCGR